MVLKNLLYRQGKTLDVKLDEWYYIDNIESASSYYDEDIAMPVLSCLLRDENVITVEVPRLAYLMSDDGKTIDKIVARD